MSTPLVLIELYADRLGGHHQRTLTALAQTRPGTLVITPGGAPWAVRDALRDADARLVTQAAGRPARLMTASSRALERVSRAGQRLLRRCPARVRRWPHQITLVSRLLAEAAALRTARRLAPGATGVVILSASEALHGAAAGLGGLPHLRFVHELVTREDAGVRLLGLLGRPWEDRVIALCPTRTVQEQVSGVFPRLRVKVRAFAVDDGLPLTPAELSGARTAFSIPDQDAVVCLVGGWWPSKDITAVDAALARLTEPLHLIVAGSPTDPMVLARWRDLPLVHLHTVPGPVSEPVLRLVYAASDAALVARPPDTGKESGLVMDAARLGVPLIVSDHDPALTARLAQEPWARVFTASRPDHLAGALDALVRQPLALPGPDAPAAVGMATATGQAAFLIQAARELQEPLSCPPPPP
ncbi:hypothetical protein ACFVIM_06775 [Streptomyces sp. NPDC057638]|uniref:hypothetical protein n=1 Tax=Streptomyces sp. NPDC057638 TaxID=3346190 RepID=UPI00367FA755